MSEYDCIKQYEYGRDMREIERRLDRLDGEVDYTPYFLVGLTADHPYKRIYVASFSSRKKLDEFVRSCRRRKDGEFKIRSPLGGFMDFEVVRFYAPDLPHDPQNHEG